jgi:hypothetical protein
MTIKSAGNKSLTIILIAAAVLCICGSLSAGNPKNKSTVKLPVFKNAKDVKFDADDQKFFVWLNKYVPEEAEGLKDFESNPTEYLTKFRNLKSSWRRLWKGYKENKKYGEALVVEVRLRKERTRNSAEKEDSPQSFMNSVPKFARSPLTSATTPCTCRKTLVGADSTMSA